jgi:hypothetical protein
MAPYPPRIEDVSERWPTPGAGGCWTASTLGAADAGDLCADMDMPRQSVSKHLAVLDSDRVRALSDLKRALADHPMEKPSFVYTTYIRTTPERLWRALTDPAFTERYWGVAFETFSMGWSQILSQLNTLLETGATMSKNQTSAAEAQAAAP